ncbi:cytochrome P450 [Hysterangium stoloniferum]|nr:cytochrome P450 [Hysterangium stoloniferum]
MINFYYAPLFGSLAFLFYLLVTRLRRQTISHLPGPKSPSWLIGNIASFQRPDNAAEADFAWTKEYGYAFRTKGCFGEDVLYLSDPKALQYILNKSGYNYPKTNEVRIRQQFATGHDSIVWADGAKHARQRKVMSPAFSSPALKGFLPEFSHFAKKTSSAWKDMIEKQAKSTSSSTPVINVAAWLTRTTLDIIGATAFGYQYNALEGEGSELYEVYHNLFADVHYMMSDFTIIFRRLTGYLPESLHKYIIYFPKKDLRRFRHFTQVILKVGRRVVAEQMAAQEANREVGKDVISLLSKANRSEDPKRRLIEQEVVAQVMALTFAGHETTATTLSWILHELSKNQEVQDKLREEIRWTRLKVLERGDTAMTMADLESMDYTRAETLRYHPFVLQLFREADRDDVIPLEHPQRTVTNDTVTAIPVSKGQAIMLSICVYNRLNSVWGEDAEQWRPERFLENATGQSSINLGVLANLASFSSGLRSCIGWRFSMLEMQVILVELVENFSFKPDPGNSEVKRGMASSVMQPMVKGREHEGACMPLLVTAVQDEY